jgi:hypothetical protein
MVLRILLLLLIALPLRPTVAVGQELSVPWRQLAFAGSVAHALAVGDGGRVLYLATDLGLHVSEDGGDTWLYAGQGLEAAGAPRVDALAVSSRDPETAFAGTLAGANAGLYVTHDLGHTWRIVWQGRRAEGVSAFATAHDDPRRIMAAVALRELGEDYLVASADGGERWAAVHLDSGSYRTKLLALTLTSGGTSAAYAATTQGLFVSSDGGGTWRDTGRASDAAAVTAIPGRTDFAFASSGRGLLVSRDGGSSWQSFRGPRLSVCETYAQDGLGAVGGRAPLLVATTASSCPGEPGRIYGTLLAGNRSARWFFLDSGLPLAERPRIVVDDTASPRAYALTHDGLWVADLSAVMGPSEPPSAVETATAERGIENAAPVPNSPETAEQPSAVPAAEVEPAAGSLGGEGDMVVTVVTVAAGVAVLLAVTHAFPWRRRGRG